jgi:hypothetical protein
VEWLKVKALSSSPSTTKKKIKIKINKLASRIQNHLMLSLPELSLFVELIEQLK